MEAALLILAAASPPIHWATILISYDVTTSGPIAITFSGRSLLDWSPLLAHHLKSDFDWMTKIARSATMTRSR